MQLNRRNSRSMIYCAALAACGALTLAMPVVTSADDAMWNLPRVLERIDDAVKSFDDGTANVSIEHVIAGKDTPTTGSGKIYFRSDGRMRVEVEFPKPRTILCTDKDLYLFRPAELIVETYKLKDHPERLEQYPMLGFITTGTDLEKDYLVTLLQEEMVNDRKVLQLEVTPKAMAVRANISRIQIWIDEGTWLPVRQKIFHSQSETYLDITYAGFSSNTGLDSDLFKPRWPKGTKKIKR